jgi:hypothetical protein
MIVDISCPPSEVSNPLLGSRVGVGLCLDQGGASA